MYEHLSILCIKLGLSFCYSCLVSLPKFFSATHSNSHILDYQYKKTREFKYKPTFTRTFYFVNDLRSTWLYLTYIFHSLASSHINLAYFKRWFQDFSREIVLHSRSFQTNCTPTVLKIVPNEIYPGCTFISSVASFLDILSISSCLTTPPSPPPSPPSEK